jgi:hypothetical protein
MKNNEVIKTSAIQIFNFLSQEVQMGQPWPCANKTQFNVEYAKRCKSLGISAYKISIGKYLEDNDLLVFKGLKCILKGPLDEKEIFNRLKEYNANQKRDYPRNPAISTNIRRKQFRSSGQESEKKLIPKYEFLNTMTTKEIVDYLKIERKIVIINDQIYMAL